MTDTLARLKKVGERVEYILSVYPQTRGDDRLLVSYYYEVFEGIKEDDTFFDVMGREKLTKAETITRVRRKVQETRIELRAEKDIEAMRMAEQKGYLDFAGSTI